MTICSDPNCNIICHSTCLNETKIQQIPQFAGLTCFEIAHHPECANLFVSINRKDKTYTRSVLNHQVPIMVKDIYEGMLPRRSNRARGRPANRTNTTRRNGDQPVEEIFNDTPSTRNISNLTTPQHTEQKKRTNKTNNTQQQETMTTRSRRNIPGAATKKRSQPTQQKSIRRSKRQRSNNKK